MKISYLILVFFFVNALFANLSDDLTEAVIDNDVDELIEVIDNASSSSVSFQDMLSAAAIALSNTTATLYNNVARQYLHDFYVRPYYHPVSSNVLYVDPSLFESDQIGSDQYIIVTSDRIIFPDFYAAMYYIANRPESSWEVMINQGFYDEDVSIPANKNIILTGVGGVVIGNGLADQFSSTTPRTLTWDISDNSSNNCSLKIQSLPYGCDTYRNFSYTRFLIGNNFKTNIVSSITTPPILEFDSVYPWNGMGSSATDIGYVSMILRNVRMGGSLNFTSAAIQEIDTMLLVPPVTCRSLGTVIHNVFYDNWTIQNQFSNTLIDCAFGATSKIFTLQTSPYQLNINSSSYYWWHNKTWSVGGSTVLVPQPTQ